PAPADRTVVYEVEITVVIVGEIVADHQASEIRRERSSLPTEAGRRFRGIGAQTLDFQWPVIDGVHLDSNFARTSVATNLRGAISRPGDLYAGYAEAEL